MNDNFNALFQYYKKVFGDIDRNTMDEDELKLADEIISLMGWKQISKHDNHTKVALSMLECLSFDELKTLFERVIELALAPDTFNTEFLRLGGITWLLMPDLTSVTLTNSRHKRYYLIGDRCCVASTIDTDDYERYVQISTGSLTTLIVILNADHEVWRPINGLEPQWLVN